MDDDGYPLFQLVLSDRYLQQVRELLREGEDPNHQLPDGRTPLQLASMSFLYNTEVIKKLINAGADVNLSNQFGYTPLHYAVLCWKQSAVNVLVRFGAHLNAKTFTGKTPLHLAVANCGYTRMLSLSRFVPDLRIIKTLLDQEDLECNAVDRKGETSLMKAVKHRLSNVTQILLYKGANPNISSRTSLTPLHVALVRGPISIIRLLLVYGASIYAEDEKGRSPMSILIQKIKSNGCYVKYFKFIAFKYHISEEFKLKLESLPGLSKRFNAWCREVDQMRKDYVYGSITVHDFVNGCFNEPQKPEENRNLILLIYQPVVKRLIADIYPEFLREILTVISNMNLLSIMEVFVSWRKNLRRHSNSREANLFSNIDVIYLISRYLSHIDVFSLIVAVSNSNIPGSLKNLHERLCRFKIKHNI